MPIRAWMLTFAIGCGPRGETLSELMESAERKGLSGAVLAVHHGSVLLDDAYGDAIRGQDPFTTDTVSSIGSLTKQFTGAMVLAAEQDGLLTTEDTLSDHLTGVPAEMADISIHQLLTHRACLEDAIGLDEAHIERDAWLRQVWQTPLRCAPGKKFRYSNVGYGVAAAILEAVTGQTYEQYLRERLLLPLGIEQTGYDGPDWSDHTVAHGYHRDEAYGPPLALTLGEDHWNVVGNGELLSTTADLRAWIEALAEGTALPPEQVERLWGWQTDTGGPYGYGYGWGIEEDGAIVEHDGSNGYYFAHAAWWRDEELLVILLSNDLRFWSPSFVWDIGEVILDE